MARVWRKRFSRPAGKGLLRESTAQKRAGADAGEFSGVHGNDSTSFRDRKICMEGFYALLILISGGSIALLGFFLFAAEREIKKYKREIEELKREGKDAPGAGFVESVQREAAVLTAYEAGGQAELDAISSRLAAAEEELERFRLVEQQGRWETQQVVEANQRLQGEIEAERHQLATLRAELDEFTAQNRRMAEENERLAMELFDERQTVARERQETARRVSEEQESHRIQAQAWENHMQESLRDYEEMRDRCARLQAEIADYQDRLERSQSRVRELESAGESAAMNDPEQREKLEALVADLERELAEGKNQAAALAETHERLRETERLCHELSAENHRLREEIAHWQGRFEASEQNQAQVSLLQQQLAALQVEHARAAESYRQTQERAGGKSEAEPSLPAARSGFYFMALLTSKLRAVTSWVSTSSGSGELREDALRSTDAAEQAAPASANEPSWRSILRHWRLGVASAGVVLLALVAVVTLRSASTEAPIAGDSVVFPPEPISVEPVRSAEKRAAKPAPRVRGSFQTVRPTQVFSGPSENSALIANIGAGMKLNVVDSKNGWLEIRSKHGRPPGFIRQEAAVRVGSN